MKKHARDVALLIAAVLCATGVWPQNQSSAQQRAAEILRVGNQQYDDGKYEEAAKSYQRAIDIDPDWASPHYELGQTYWRLKRPDDATRELELALKLNPQCSLCYQGLATNADDSGNTAQAIEFYKKAIAVAPDQAQPHFNLAVTYLRLGHHDDAVAELKEAERIEPDYASPYFLLGNLYARQEKLYLAWDQLFQATKLEKAGRRYEDAKKLIDTNIVVSNKLSADETADHLSYCLSRAASMLPEEYRKRHPDADTYAETLAEEVSVFGRWATVMTEIDAKKETKRAPELANLVKIHKAGHLAPYLLLVAGDRLQEDRKKYEAENPGKIEEFEKWAKDNAMAIVPVRARCEVRWMNRTW